MTLMLSENDVDGGKRREYLRQWLLYFYCDVQRDAPMNGLRVNLFVLVEASFLWVS